VAERLVPIRSGSIKSLKLAKGWIESCFQNYIECRLSSENKDPLLPTRVIDVQSLNQCLVHLLFSEGKRGKWLALSHRWPVSAGQIVVAPISSPSKLEFRWPLCHRHPRMRSRLQDFSDFGTYGSIRYTLSKTPRGIGRQRRHKCRESTRMPMLL
jgi:hypothetical protein